MKSLRHIATSVIDGEQLKHIVGRNGNWYLSGGFDASTGPRSSYKRTIVAIDSSGVTKWSQTTARSYPFELIDVMGTMIVAWLLSNFTREKRGVWLFDARSGEEIEFLPMESLLDLAVGRTGLVAAIPNYVKERVSIERIYPNPTLIGTVRSSEEEEDLQKIVYIDNDRLLLTFALFENDPTIYKHELWNLADFSKVWEFFSENNVATQLTECIALFSNTEECKRIQLLSKEDGTVKTELEVAGPGINRVVSASAHEFCWMDDFGELGVATISGDVVLRERLENSDGGWLNVAANENREIAVTYVEGHQSQRTKFSLFKLEY